MDRFSRREFLLSAMALSAAGTFGCAAATTASSGSGSVLRSPFPDTPAMPGKIKARFDCEAPPPTVTALASISKYEDDDSSRSRVNAEAEARLRKENEPVTAFSRGITRMTDDVVSDPAAASAQAQCAWNWLAAWAEGNALQGDAVAEAVRKWELATAACAVLKLRGRSTPPAPQQAAVHAWLRRLAANVRSDYSKRRDKASRQNNHLYWAAWAVAASGIAVDDRELFDWGLQQYDYALSQIQPDGHLPREAARGSRALFYHAFALLPLTLLAEAGEVNGRGSWQAQNGRLATLAGFVLDGYANPARLEALSRERQDMDEGLNPRSAAWLEPYYARTRDARAVPWLRRMRPLAHRSAGGDLTAMFGQPLPA